MWPRQKAAPEAAEKKFEVTKTEAEWRQELTPAQFSVLRQHGTERARSSLLDKQYGPGRYYCAGCDRALFDADSKFDSGTGWPSFHTPLEGGVGTTEDSSFFMRRTEVHCARCGGHLGHVFPDGPAPTGQRYCMNGVSLRFEPQAAGKAVSSSPAAAETPKPSEPAADKTTLATATFAAGCFWGVEEEFRQLDGVVETMVGYTGGKTANPTYEQVCSKNTGHAEAVKVTYDPAKVPYEKLLETFWQAHDPTTLNRQGPDVGSQYRSAIFANDEAQAAAARASKEALEKAGRFRRPIVTEIVPAPDFHRAEDYHQQYIAKRGGH